MRWLRGDAQNQDRTRQFLERCQRLARNRNRSWSFEWVGEREPAPSVVHFTELGSQPPGGNIFFPRAYLLRRLQGVIERIDGPQAGRIRVMPGTLTAHFRPRLKFLQTRDINATVDFFIGFTYDGLRAYEVEYPGEYRGPARPKTPVAQLVAAPIDSSIAPRNTVESYEVDADPAAKLAGPNAHQSRKAGRLVLDLGSCRDAIAGSSGDEACRRAIENLIKQCESAGARLDSLRLGEVLQNVLGLSGYQRLKGGGKLRPAISRLGFTTEQGPGAFFVSSGHEGS
ncbi:MAG: hypothetical protein ACR2FV_17115 [Ornithinimicrobium sp.]|uniref:hypothetical protein n=1 Tax=Ornithinimicrobium sp. TaxID=1977084 RepID=UPI003D9AFDA6